MKDSSSIFPRRCSYFLLSGNLNGELTLYVFSVLLELAVRNDFATPTCEVYFFTLNANSFKLVIVKKKLDSSITKNKKESPEIAIIRSMEANALSTPFMYFFFILKNTKMMLRVFERVILKSNCFFFMSNCFFLTRSV